MRLLMIREGVGFATTVASQAVRCRDEDRTGQSGDQWGWYPAVLREALAIPRVRGVRVRGKECEGVVKTESRIKN